MWTGSHRVTVKDVSREMVWMLWSDVTSWPRGNTDLEYARMQQPFDTGASIELKPRGAPVVWLHLDEVDQGRVFRYHSALWLAELTGVHELEDTDEGLVLTTTMSVKGPMSWVWRKLVVEGIVRSLPASLDRLVAGARQVQEMENIVEL